MSTQPKTFISPVEHFVRQPDKRWLLAETNRFEDSLHLSSMACDLAPSEIYDKVEMAG